MTENVYAARAQGQSIEPVSLNPVKTPIFGPEHTLLALQRQDVRGIYYSTWNLDDAARRAAKTCDALGLEFILGIQHMPGENDVFVQECTGLTKKLAFGNDRYGELNPFGDEAFGGVFHVELIEQYRDEATRLGYEWVCAMIHPALVWDYATGRRAWAILKAVQWFCMTGHLLMRYLYADPTMRYDNDGVFDGKDIHAEYGLTIEGLRDYLAPLNVWSGAGFQQGLNAGSRVYAERLGFKGVVAGIPFDLRGTLDVKVRDKPETYPEKWGSYE